MFVSFYADITFINCGKTTKYYKRKLKEISEFIIKYDTIYFA